MKTDLQMYRVFLVTNRLGDGYRTVLDVTPEGSKSKTALLFVPAYLTTVKYDRSALRAATVVPYSKERVRKMILRRAQLCRKFPDTMHFDRKTTSAVLQALGGRAVALREVPRKPLAKVVELARMSHRFQARSARLERRPFQPSAGQLALAI